MIDDELIEALEEVNIRIASKRRALLSSIGEDQSELWSFKFQISRTRNVLPLESGFLNYFSFNSLRNRSLH